MRVYAPTCVYRDQYLKIRAPPLRTHTSCKLQVASCKFHDPRMYTHPPATCAFPYTHPGVREPARCVYAPTAASKRICANAARGAYTRTYPRSITRRCVYAGTRRTSCNNMRTGSGEAGVSDHVTTSRPVSVTITYFGKARAGCAVERRPERHQTPPESLQIPRRVAPARKDAVVSARTYTSLT